jgi:hypothetical protein
MKTADLEETVADVANLGRPLDRCGYFPSSQQLGD